MNEIEEIISYIENLYEEFELPKNVCSKLNMVRQFLNEDCELSIKKSKCLTELDDLHENKDIDSSLRCQLWDIVSSLEQL